MNHKTSAIPQGNSRVNRTRIKNHFFPAMDNASRRPLKNFNLLAFLTNTDLFGRFSGKNKARIAAIAYPKEIKKDQTLFLEGEEGTAIYLLATGNILLSKSNASGNRSVIVKSVGQGELFAEVILFEEDRYPVTATATGNSLVFIISRKRFLSLLELPDFRNEFISMLFRKQRYLSERLRSLVTMGADEKLFHFLKQHYGPGERIVPGVPKKILAAAIDVAPETLSRLLLRLKKEGTLVWRGKEIFIRKEFWHNFNE
jgi:CRP/FNR family transcriptional regulator